jgi:hypothetical protein
MNNTKQNLIQKNKINLPKSPQSYTKIIINPVISKGSFFHGDTKLLCKSNVILRHVVAAVSIYVVL